MTEQSSNESKRHVQRKPQREVMDKSEIYSIFDEGLVAHVGFVDPDSHEPVVIPMAYGRSGDTLLLHGSTGSRMFMALKKGLPICVTVTLIDGIVIARSAFNSSMNYRSVMAFGIPRVLEGDAKYEGLVRVTDSIVPGFWDEAREMVKKEEAQTMVLELDLDQVSAKKRIGEANDGEESNLPNWAGVLPVRTVIDEPITNSDATHTSVPQFVKNRVRK